MEPPSVKKLPGKVDNVDIALQDVSASNGCQQNGNSHKGTLLLITGGSKALKVFNSFKLTQAEEDSYETVSHKCEYHTLYKMKCENMFLKGEYKKKDEITDTFVTDKNKRSPLIAESVL